MPFDSSPNENNYNSQEQTDSEHRSAPKRPARESLVLTQISKTPRLSEYDSCTRLWHIIDKRMSKNNEIICEKIDEKIRESEKRIVDLFERKFDEIRRDVSVLTKRVDALETVSSEVIVLTKEVNNLKTVSSDIDALKKEINVLKIELDKRDNSSVASDIRINGVPCFDNENLPQIYQNLCNNLRINSPALKSIFRLRHTRSTPNNSDATIIVKFFTPYQRNMFLKSIAYDIKQNGPLKLSILGFDTNVPFYVNENLTPLNYGIYLQALRMKRDKILESVYTRRGKVNVKLHNTDDFYQILSIEDLYKLLHPADENLPKNL